MDTDCCIGWLSLHAHELFHLESTQDIYKLVFYKYFIMSKQQDVLVTCDVDIEPITPIVRYRVYVGDCLFTERTWRWSEHFLRENIQIRANKGKYQIRIELVHNDKAWLRVNNWRVVRGKATVNDVGFLEI